MAGDSAALLRERGIQVTAQRLAVLRAVAGHPHITADAVAEIVRNEIVGGYAMQLRVSGRTQMAISIARTASGAPRTGSRCRLEASCCSLTAYQRQ